VFLLSKIRTLMQTKKGEGQEGGRETAAKQAGRSNIWISGRREGPFQAGGAARRHEEQSCSHSI
jgi:hypothetical protein